MIVKRIAVVQRLVVLSVLPHPSNLPYLCIYLRYLSVFIATLPQYMLCLVLDQTSVSESYQVISH